MRLVTQQLKVLNARESGGVLKCVCGSRDNPRVNASVRLGR